MMIVSLTLSCISVCLCLQMHGMAGLNKVIFRDAYEKPVFARYRSLFPGLGFAAGYKVSQRIYKFGGQPVVKDYMTKNHASFFEHTFGERNAKTMMHATAGSLIGIGEIALLPLDVLKIRAQTNPAAIAGKGVAHIFKTEGFALYRGAGWTAARNAPARSPCSVDRLWPRSTSSSWRTTTAPRSSRTSWPPSRVPPPVSSVRY